MLNLAITSRSSDGNPETFVKAHCAIRENILFYYGDMVPRYLKGQGLISVDRNALSSPKTLLKIAIRFNPIKFLHFHLGIMDYLLAESFRKNKVDVVLSEYGDCSALVMCACRAYGIPLVAHFHGRDCSSRDVIKEFSSQYKELFAYASSVVAVSHVMEKKLISLGCPKEKLVYAPCVPDAEYYDIVPNPKGKQLVSIGRFVDKKAPFATLMAFKKVLEKHPDAMLVMAGDGPLLSATKHLAEIVGLNDKVSFPGNVAHEIVFKLLSESRIYVQHSVTADDGDMEGTPVSVMEASAAGIPVVSTIHAGIPDVIVHGKTGLLSDEYDINAMAENIDILLSDEKRSQSMGMAGKEFMKNNFSKEHQIDVLTDAVEKAAKRKMI
jgi:colanic acid/amylovoran biosynthesis glycosyltransferase